MISFDEMKKLKAEGKLLVLAVDRGKYAAQGTAREFVKSLLNTGAFTPTEIVDNCVKSGISKSPKSVYQNIYILKKKKEIVGFYFQGNYFLTSKEKAEEIIFPSEKVKDVETPTPKGRGIALSFCSVQPIKLIPVLEPD